MDIFNMIKEIPRTCEGHLASYINFQKEKDHLNAKGEWIKISDKKESKIYPAAMHDATVVIRFPKHMVRMSTS
jgi:hypothetical protein